MNLNNLIAISDPKSYITEAYRTLRTNIRFSSADNKMKVVLVTSSGPGEGKTTTSANLAVIMAQSGMKTLLIDCDLRKPKVHRMFKLTNQLGLTNLLVGEAELNEATNNTSVDNLHVLTSGTKPPNPAEILESQRMQNLLDSLREEYDCIILDTPPIILVTDAQILSKYVDGSLLVVSQGETDLDAIVVSKELLERVDAKIIGVVFNKIDAAERRYYKLYYQYYYSNDNDDNGKRSKRGIFKGFGKKRRLDA